jgi:hypothetical protein
MKAIPRLRGRAAQIDSPPEDAGKWLYELTMWDLSGEHQVGEPWFFGPFETEAIAKTEGREITKKVSQTVEKEITGEVSGRFLDLKNGGIMRPWDEN